MKYNSQREHIRLREYGRHIQRMIARAIEIEDDKKRQEAAEVIVGIMGNVNPHLKNVEDFKHLLWDHLHILSDWKLNVESPYPIPEREVLEQRPEPFPYPKSNKKNRHYGVNVQRLIEQVDSLENEEKREEGAKLIADYMKLVSNGNNGRAVNDDHIKNDLEVLSEGRLSVDDDTRLQHVKVQKQSHKGKGRGRGKRRGHSNKRKNYRR